MVEVGCSALAGKLSKQALSLTFTYNGHTLKDSIAMLKTLNFQIKALVILLFLNGAAYAIPIEWEFDSVYFDDGGVVSGSFIYDNDTGGVFNWSVLVSGGDENAFSPFEYSYHTGGAGSSAQPLYGRSERAIIFDEISQMPPSNNLFNRQLRITPSETLDGSVANVNLLYLLGDIGSEECWSCSPYREIVSGSLSLITIRDDFILPVSEPFNISLFAFFLFGLVRLKTRLYHL